MTTAFENLAPRIMGDLIFDFGLTPEQAAGVVGNLGAESGLRAVQEARPIRGRHSASIAARGRGFRTGS